MPLRKPCTEQKAIVIVSLAVSATHWIDCPLNSSGQMADFGELELILAQTRRVFGSFFVDLGDQHIAREQSKEEPS